MHTTNTQNITSWFRSVTAIHKPASIEEVRALVQVARQTKTPIYPVSTGFNWGYGSRSPITDQCALVDLSRMNRILNADEISENNPVAVIEPGVTQGQLYDFLQSHCPGLGFNVTGSGRDTSIIGNALDRGVGYQGPRSQDIFALEIVTGAGELLQTGFRRLGTASPLAHSHPHGLGPMLDGLFLQGNFGIVTSACFRLLPRRPVNVALSLSVRNEQVLPDFINTLARLKRENLLPAVTHIANRARSLSTLNFGMVSYLENDCGLGHDAAMAAADQASSIVAAGEWTCLTSISGNKAQVKAVLQEVRGRLKKFGYLKVITDQRLDLAFVLTHALRFLPLMRAHAAAISAVRPLHRLALGEPTDIPVKNLLWAFGEPEKPAVALDQSHCGLLFISPALPSDGILASRILDELKRIAVRFQHTLYITINIETETALAAIINLLFDRRSDEEIRRAHACADALLEYIHEQGLELYRARADSMEKITARHPDYWKKIRELKQVFDPDNIIAPGRYNLL